MKSRSFLAAALLAAMTLPAFGAAPGFGGPGAANPAMQGRTFFRAQCLLCHSAEPGDNGGAQGPGLQGLMGREAAASGDGFGYTNALKNSGITWDADSLSHFLAAPTEAVPGTSMVIPVPSEADRNNLVAYFNALRDGSLNTGARACTCSTRSLPTRGRSGPLPSSSRGRPWPAAIRRPACSRPGSS